MVNGYKKMSQLIDHPLDTINHNFEHRSPQFSSVYLNTNCD